MVSESNGTPFFFVNRIEADMAFCADFKALWSGPKGTSRLIVLDGAAD